MRLRRGVERGSCDFCHRRKIKCDRSSRANEGHSGCSQCDLREVECRLDETDDIRVRRRRQANAQKVAVDGNVAEQSTTSFSPHDSISSSSIPPTASQTTQATTTPADELPYLPFLDASPFDLCSDSIFFLDEIFVTEYESPCWGSAPVMPNQRDVSAAAGDQMSDQRQHQLITTPHPDTPDRQSYWQSCNLNSNTFFGALHAYFDLAALSLPVVLEDAFWQDFEADRCSDALVCAIACRGIPFLEVADKWEIQQRLATRFKDVFLGAQEVGSSGGVMRLDDLEALALMVHFEYDDSNRSSLQSHLERLFFNHDSLVLMILQSQIQDHGSTNSVSSGMLARAKERRTLLFWHVYGLDAFHSLDCKSLSRIPDDDDGLAEKIPLQGDGGYLDAILVLAIIARKIMQLLCNHTVRRKGVKPTHILSIYDQLDHWRHKSCPKHLRTQLIDAEKPRSVGEQTALASAETSQTILLHRTVLLFLEANLYMQIEDCVDRYGISLESTFEAEMVAHRVEYETLRVAHRVVEVSEWSRKYSVQGPDNTQHSLVDMAPSILRNICAGVCFWTCTHGKELLQARPGSMTRFKLLPSSGSAESGETDVQDRVRKYIEIAGTLRDVVATATSHKDTYKVLDRLDTQLHSLNETVNSSYV